MANFTEVYEGQFNLTGSGVDDIISSLQKLDNVAKQVAGTLGKFQVKIPKIDLGSALDTSKVSTAVKAVEVASTQIETALRTTTDVAKADFQQLTEIVRSQIARLPDKTAPEFYKITDQFKTLMTTFKTVSAAGMDTTPIVESLRRLSGEIDATGVAQARFKEQTLAVQKTLASPGGAELVSFQLQKLQTEFDNVSRLSNLTSVSLSDRWSGLGLIFSDTGSKLQGLREVFAGTNSSSNLFVKGLDLIISRGDPMKALSSDLAKSLSSIAENTNRAFQSLQIQQANLKQTFTKEIGTGSVVFEKFNEQLTKTNAAFKQIQVTAQQGGDVSAALIRAKVEADNLKRAYQLVAQDGAIPAGTQTAAMFEAMGKEIDSTGARLQAMAGRYEGVKKKIAETKAEQDKQAASGQKQTTVFEKVATSAKNMFTTFTGGKKDIENAAQGFRTLDGQIEKTTGLMETFKGSFLGSFAGTLIGNLTSQLGGFFSTLGSQFYDVNNTVQNTRITIQGMLEGSGVDAKAAIQGFTDFVTEQAAKTPFEFGDAVQQALRLVQQGFDPQKWFTPAANAAAAMNKPMEQFINGMVKLQAGAKGAAIDMFRDFGLNVNQISGYFDKATGQALSFEEVQKRTADGTISSAEKMNFQFDKQGSLANSTGDALKILNAYLSQNATFAKAAEARSLSLDGVISNLKDSVTKVFLAFGQPLFDKLTLGATGLLNKINVLQPAITAVAANLGTGLASAIDYVTNLFNGGLFASLQNSEGLLLDLANLITAISQGQWQTAWSLILEIASSALDGVLSYLDNFASNAYDWGANFISQIADGIYEAAGEVLDAVAEIGNAIASYLMPGSPPEKGPLSTIDKWGKGVIDVWTEGTSRVDTAPIERALGRVKDVFSKFDLGSAQQDVLNIQEQINQAEAKGYVPAELKKQLQLAKDKVTLLQQQEQLQSQIDQQAQQAAQQQDKAKAKKTGGSAGGGAGAGGHERVGAEKKTALQIRDDALKILDQQLKDGVIKYEDYAKSRLKIEKDFYNDTLKEGGNVSQENLANIKHYQDEVDKIEASQKKGKKTDKPSETFTPASAKDIFANFAKNVVSSVTDVGSEAGQKFVASMKQQTVKQLDTVKTEVVTKLGEVTTKAAENIGTLFDKIKGAIKPEYLPVIAGIAGALAYLASGPIIAGFAALAGAIGTVLSAIGSVLIVLPIFLALGLAITAVIYNWDKITYAAGKAFEYLKGIWDEFVKTSGGFEALKNNFNAAMNVIKEQGSKAITKIMNGLYKIVRDFNFKGAFYSFTKAFKEIDLSALKNTLANLFAPLLSVIAPKLTQLKDTILGLVPPQVSQQVSNLVASFTNLFQQGTLGANFLNLFKQLGELFAALLPVIKAAGAVLLVAAGIIVNIFVSALQGIVDAMPFITGAIAGLTQVLTGVIDFFTAMVSLVTAGWALVMGDTATASTRFQEFLTNMAGAITNIFGGALQFIINVGVGFLAWSLSFVTSFVANILQFIPGFQNAASAVTGFRDYVIGAMSTLVSNVLPIVYGLTNQLQIILPAAWNYLISKTGEFIQEIKNWFVSLYNDLVGQSIVPDMITAILAVFDGFVTSGIEFIGKWVSSMVSRFKEVTPKFVEMGSNIIKGLLDGINASKDKVIEVLKSLAGDAISSAAHALGIQSPSVRFRELGVQVVNGFNQGIQSVKPTIGDFVGAAADDVEKILDRSLTGSKVKAVLHAFKNTFRDNYDEIIKLGAHKGGELLAQLSRATQAAGVKGGEQGKAIRRAADEFVTAAIKQQQQQPLDFAKKQAKTLESINKLTTETLTKFNQQVFNIRNSSTEARIELEKLFNRTVTDDEVTRMAEAFQGTPVDKLTEQQKLIYRNYLLQQKLAGATEEEAKVREQIGKFSQLNPLISQIQDAVSTANSTQAQQAAQNAGNQILQSLGLGMDAGTDDVLAKLTTITAQIVAQVQANLGIHSPSTLFIGFGQNLMSGLSQGIVGAQGQVSTALAGVSNLISGSIDLSALTAPSIFDTTAIGGFNQLALATPQGSLPPITITMHNTINDDFDEAKFNARVRQAVVQAVRTGR